MTYNLNLTDGELCELLNMCSARRRELGNKYHIEPAADLRSLMHKALVADLKLVGIEPPDDPEPRAILASKSQRRAIRLILDPKPDTDMLYDEAGRTLVAHGYPYSGIPQGYTWRQAMAIGANDLIGLLEAEKKCQQH